MSSSRNTPERKEKRRLAPIVEVKESLVTIDATVSPVTKNEVGHILLGEVRGTVRARPPDGQYTQDACGASS